MSAHLGIPANIDDTTIDQKETQFQTNTSYNWHLQKMMAEHVNLYSIFYPLSH